MARMIFHIAFISFLFIITACEKEYSYEGGITPIIIDTGTGSVPPRPYTCPSCIGADNYIEGKWSFYNADTFYCGIIDTAIATPDRNGFTFFGPSSCSIDSGLVLTINIEPNSLTHDILNITTSRAGLYYYDNVGQTHPFVTRAGFPFSFTIESYVHQTRIMTGRFNGTVFKPGGEATILNGKYKVKML